MELNLVFAVLVVTGDRSSNRSAGRPDTGRSGFNARRNELQRIRNKPIVFVVIIAAAIIFSLVAIILHNNQQIQKITSSESHRLQAIDHRR